MPNAILPHLTFKIVLTDENDIGKRGPKELLIRPTEKEQGAYVTQLLHHACCDIFPGRADKVGEQAKWVNAINEILTNLHQTSDLPVQPGEDNQEVTVRDGFLFTQPSNTKRPWAQKFYALTTTALYSATNELSPNADSVYPLNPTCSVFETNLKPNAFELVTTQMALHLQGSSPEDTQAWIKELRGVISNSKVMTVSFTFAAKNA